MPKTDYPHKNNLTRKKQYTTIVEDRKETDSKETTTTKLIEKVKPNVDTEAAWIIKAGKIHYGYKQHTVTNQEGFILGIHTTAANESDVKNLKTALDKVVLKPRTPVFADKGYVSAEINATLIDKK